MTHAGRHQEPEAEIVSVRELHQGAKQEEHKELASPSYQQLHMVGVA